MQELERFLLDCSNILWFPEQIFQDIESNVFSFLYIPYYEGESSFVKLLDFWVEHIDYNDEVLVDCVYHMYEQLERCGDVYFQAKIFEDAKVLDQPHEKTMQEQIDIDQVQESHPVQQQTADLQEYDVRSAASEKREEKRGFLGLFENKRRKGRDLRENYRLDMQRAMDGYAVAEETSYMDEEYGQTVYIEEQPETTERVRRLYTPEDRLVASMEKPILTIGKKKEEVDVVLEDSSVSRMHARISKEGQDYYLEDLNSTNGTFKNGLRLQPYEKKKLETGDELKCGRVTLIFR